MGSLIATPKGNSKLGGSAMTIMFRSGYGPNKFQVQSRGLVQAKMKLPTVSTQEQEHEWRELLQKQLAEHWLSLYYPDENKVKPVILEKIRGSDGKVA